MDQIAIRHATQSDLPAIVALLHDDVLGRTREDPSLPLNQRYVDAFEEMTGDPNQLMIVMEQAGAIIGCLQISLLPGLTLMGTRRGQLEGVHIAAGKRGNGLGRRLLQWAIDECRGRGCGLVQLTANKQRGDAHRFYESLGFTASHVGFKLEL